LDGWVAHISQANLFPFTKSAPNLFSLSLTHTHTHKIHHLFYKIPTPNSTGNHNLDEEEEGIEP
jgi:hypothetical protein